MVTFNFFLSQNMMTFEYFFYKNPLLNFHCVFLFGAKVRKFAKNKNAAVQDVKRTWKYIRSGNRCLGGGYCLYMAKPLVACRYTQWPSPRDWLCTWRPGPLCVMQLEGTLCLRILSSTDWNAFWKLVCLCDGMFQFLKPPCTPLFHFSSWYPQWVCTR